MYVVNPEGWEEAKNYAIAHPELFIRKDQDVEIATKKRILEEAYRHMDNWWKIAKSEWGTAGIPTLGYFSILDHNILAEVPLASAIILTPFLLTVAVTLGVEATKELYEIEKKEEPLLFEMSSKMGEVMGIYMWFFHIPFIVYSGHSFPPETKYILRYYPEDYSIWRDEKIEAEAVYVTSRKSMVERETVGFFYYLVFPTEKILEALRIGISFNEETSELRGMMVLTVVTNIGEELIFPFDLSKMR